MYLEEWDTNDIYPGVSGFMHLEYWNTRDILVYPDSCIWKNGIRMIYISWCIRIHVSNRLGFKGYPGVSGFMYLEEWDTNDIYPGVSGFMYVVDWDTRDILVYPDSCI